MDRTRKLYTVALCIAAVLFACAGVNASVLNVSDIQISNPGTFYSYASGTGSLSLNSSITGLLKLTGESYNYSFTNASISMSSTLVQDTSTGGLANGLFSGGQTITITGTIKYTPTNTTVYTGTILAATMCIDSSCQWILTESTSGAINGNVNFIPLTTVGLGSGITFGSNVLKIGDFRSDFAFKGLLTNPTKFATTQTLRGVASTIQITAIPEPTSIAIFVLSLVTLGLKKK
ncbi:MAG: PEP-CTERM sorting domain-containing protein [Planctomycetaceae bacterium]|nr:PEP-CTERM sorting domain-containing protein [Planctomycetaceae bacterium]